MLLAALAETGRVCSKQETIDHIRRELWFDVQPEDLQPYPSQTYQEPRWHTLIAFSRKDAVETGLMFDHPRDEWEIARPGLDAYRELTDDFATGELDVSRCYLWSHSFKRRMRPGFQPSRQDAKRPNNLYRDAGLRMTPRGPGRDVVTRARELLERLMREQKLPPSV